MSESANQQTPAIFNFQSTNLQSIHLQFRTFWQRLDDLVAGSRVIIDRPKGTAHPRYPEFVYPLDYGYLEGTQAIDGEGVDVWVGSLPEARVTAVVCNVDMVKRDTELKLLLGCTPEEAEIILQTHNSHFQSAILIPRPE